MNEPRWVARRFMYCRVVLRGVFDGDIMGDQVNIGDARAKAFSHRLRSGHSKAPRARDVLGVEEDLGTGAVGSQLSTQGKRLLFRALDRERKAKLRAQKG